MRHLGDGPALAQVFLEREMRPVEHHRGVPLPQAPHGQFKAGSVIEVEKDRHGHILGHRHRQAGERPEPAVVDVPRVCRQNHRRALLLGRL